MHTLKLTPEVNDWAKTSPRHLDFSNEYNSLPDFRGQFLSSSTFAVVVIFQGRALKLFFLKKLPSTIANVSFLKNIF